MPEIKGGRSTNWLTVFLLKEKSYKEIKNLIINLNTKNVECRPILKPMNMQPLYSKSDFISINEKSVSEYLFENGICLPSGCSLKQEDQFLISLGIKNYLKKLKYINLKSEKIKFYILFLKKIFLKK